MEAAGEARAWDDESIDVNVNDGDKLHPAVVCRREGDVVDCWYRDDGLIERDEQLNLWDERM